jgi:hypothetical protein
MPNEKKMRRDDVLAQLSDAATRSIRARPLSIAISARKSKIVDGKVQEVAEFLGYEVVHHNPAEGIKALELYGREIGMGFDGSTTLPDEIPPPPAPFDMSYRAIKAYAEREIEREDAAKRREELGITATIDQLLGLEE